MSPSRPATARAIAARVLTRTDPQKADVVHVLAEFLRRTDETQRTTDLVFGVLKVRCLIDAVIEKCSAVPVERIPPEILNVLRVALYELIYCPRTPEHAVVDEAVDYAKHITNTKQAGFVNAALRRTIRHIRSRQTPLSEADPRRTLPQTPSAGCEFDTDILPNPKGSPADFLSAAFSLPRWLITGWLDEYGAEITRQICFAANRRPGIYLRPNTLRTTVEGLAEKLRSDGVRCDIVAEVDMVRVNSPGAITALPGFAEGFFTVQDISANLPVRLLQPMPGWSILDLCAAPGTKTTQLAELAADKAKIIATDIDGERLKKVEENTARLGIKNVTVIEYEKLFENSKFSILNSQFDAVLLDVPCSNTGVLARRPELRHRLTKNAIEGLADTQLGLLRQAKEMVKSGAVLCYSTCSIQPQENNLLVRRFLAENVSYRLKLEKLTLPSAEGFDHDGGYVAIMDSRASAP